MPTSFLWIVMIVGVMLSLGGAFFSIVSDRKMAMSLGTALIVLVVLGPSSIKNFEAVGIKVARYQPTKEIKDLAIEFSQDKPSPEVVANTKKVIKAAAQRPEEKRSPEDYLVLATEKWRTKNYDKALGLVYAGLSLSQNDVRTHATLMHRKASIYVSLGIENLGIKFYREATKLDSQFSWPHYSLGNLYRDQKKYSEAEAEYKEAIRLDPKDGDFHFSLGNLYRDQKKYSEAEAKYKEAIRLDPKDGDFHFSLGNLYRDQKKYFEAEAKYKEAIRLDPKDTYAKNNLDLLYQKWNKKTKN